MLTPGQAHDLTAAEPLLETADPRALIGDKAYDSNLLIDVLGSRAITPVIPSRENRKERRDCDFALYRERNLAERFWNKIKHYRGIATRYDKLARNFLAAVHLVSANRPAQLKTGPSTSAQILLATPAPQHRHGPIVSMTMTHMQAQRQGELKYPTSTLLKSSNNLGWSTLFAELRSHTRREGPGTAAPHTEVAIAVRSCDVHVTSKVAGSWRSVRPTTGTIWLCPIGAEADEISIGSLELQAAQLPELQALHLYVPNGVFARLIVRRFHRGEQEFAG